MRLIDADALEREYRGQFDSVYKNVRDSVNPADFYIERKASYDKKLVKLEMEAFFEYLNNRPTTDAVPVVRCKDCRRRGSVLCPMRHEEPDGDLIRVTDSTVDDGYCSYGQRKERQSR